MIYFFNEEKRYENEKKETLLIPFKTGIDFNLDYKE